MRTQLGRATRRVELDLTDGLAESKPVAAMMVALSSGALGFDAHSPPHRGHQIELVQ
jgi:hypothetical protein